MEVQTRFSFLILLRVTRPQNSTIVTIPMMLEVLGKSLENVHFIDISHPGECS